MWPRWVIMKTSQFTTCVCDMRSSHRFSNLLNVPIIFIDIFIILPEHTHTHMFVTVHSEEVISTLDCKCWKQHIFVTHTHQFSCDIRCFVCVTKRYLFRFELYSFDSFDMMPFNWCAKFYGNWFIYAEHKKSKC